MPESQAVSPPQRSDKGLRAAARTLRAGGRTFRLAVVLVLVASAAVRILLVVQADPILVSDARDYHAYAENLAQGKGYVHTYQGETLAFNGFTFRAFRPPGYPVFLAGLYRLTGTPVKAALAANVVADLATQVCVLLLATALLGRGPALFAQVLVAIHVLWTPNPMTESIHTALFSGLVMLLICASPARCWLTSLSCGLLLVAALFTRPITVCLLPLIALKFLQAGLGRREVARLSLLLLPTALTLAWWGHRNHELFGQWVAFTTNLGHHNAYDFGINGDREYYLMRHRGLNEAQINSALLAREWSAVRVEPGRALALWLRRIVELFSLRPAWEVREVLWWYILPAGPDAGLTARLYRLSYGQYYLTYALAAAGAALLAARRKPLAGVWAAVVCFVAVQAALSRGDIRLVAPLYPLMCLLAAGLPWAVAAWRSRPRPLRPA